MTRFALTAVAATALALAGCGQGTGGNGSTPTAQLPAIKPPAGTDWASTVVATPEGGFRMGNPNAPVKFIEYASLTCPACARFSADSKPALIDKYIASGRVSWEFRSYLLHGQDLMATMALQCGGPQPFFAMIEASYATQQEWLGKMMASPPAELQRIQTLAVPEQNLALAKASGLDEFVVQRGVPRAQLQACLTDAKMPDRLLKVRDDGTKQFNIQGTPTFIINGKTVEGVASWGELEPELKAAGA